MAGVASQELRIEIDKSAYQRLGDFGEVAIKGVAGVEAIRLVYRDEDLERQVDGGEP